MEVGVGRALKCRLGEKWLNVPINCRTPNPYVFDDMTWRLMYVLHGLNAHNKEDLLVIHEDADHDSRHLAHHVRLSTYVHVQYVGGSQR